MDQHITAPAAADGLVGTRLLRGCLPPGWMLLGRARQGTGAPVEGPNGCHVLAHPARGVALLDIAPAATPNAEGRLRRALAAAGHARALPARLPVWHGPLGLAQLPRLGLLIDQAFADRAPADDAWLPALRETLASDPGWIAEAAATVLADPPAPPPPEAGATYRTADRPDADDDPLPHRGRVLLVLAALCLVFGLGLAAGRLAPWESAAPPPAAPAALVPEPAPEPAPIAERGPAAITAVTPDLPEDPASLLPALPATDPVPVPAAAAAPPPPEPIAAPPRIVRHRPPAYDRACSQAQFRWQRGDTLSAADMAYVHNGCAPTRLR